MIFCVRDGYYGMFPCKVLQFVLLPGAFLSSDSVGYGDVFIHIMTLSGFLIIVYQQCCSE